MYLLLWESPGLTLGRLCCAGNCARCGACDGRRRPYGFAMAIEGIALGTGLIAVGDAMD